MGFSVVRTLPSFSTVAANSDVTLACPVARTYHRIQLAMGGTFTRAQLTNIEVLINGKVIQRFKDGDQLQAINDYYGRPDVAGSLTLWFDRPEMATPSEVEAFALGTADVQTLQLRASIGAATSPTLTAQAEVSAPTPLGVFTKVKSYTSNHSVTGQVDVDNLPTGPRVMAIHNVKSDVDAVDMEINGRRIVEGLSKTDLEIMQKGYGRVPQTALMTTVDFCLKGRMDGALITAGAQDFRMRPTLGTSGAIEHVIEYLDQFAGI